MQVLPKSIDKVTILDSYPSVAYEIIKNYRVETTTALIRAHLDKKEQLFIECWYAKDAWLRLKEAMAKF